MINWSLLRANVGFLAGFSIAGLILGIVFAVLVTPVYRVSTVLLPVKESGQISSFDGLGGQVGGLANMLGVGIGNSSRTQEFIAELKSRKLTEKFIVENTLMPQLFNDLADPKTGEWLDDVGEDTPTLYDAYKLFNETIRFVELSAQTGLITLSIEWQNPEIAADWANGLVAMANNELRRQTIALGSKSIDYLNAELTKTNVVELRQSIYKLIEVQIQSIMLANVRDDYAFRVIDPATPPDADDYSPSRKLIVAVFCVLGFMIGLFLVAFVLDTSGGRNAELE